MFAFEKHMLNCMAAIQISWQDPLFSISPNKAGLSLGYARFPVEEGKNVPLYLLPYYQHILQK